MDFEACAGSRVHEYVWNTFGPKGTKNKQKWWIQNCGLCGCAARRGAGRGVVVNAGSGRQNRAVVEVIFVFVHLGGDIKNGRMMFPVIVWGGERMVRIWRSEVLLC